MRIGGEEGGDGRMQSLAGADSRQAGLRLAEYNLILSSRGEEGGERNKEAAK